MPGSRQQVGLIKTTLQRLGCNGVPVGARRSAQESEDDTSKAGVSKFHLDFLGHVEPVDADGPGWQILEKAFLTYPDCVLITGAPLHNPGELLKHSSCKITRWVAQGGFAGDSVVPPEYRLKKFDGMETCPTWNFGGSKDAALALLASERIARKELVSKNVCHGVAYDAVLHEKIGPHKDNYPGLAMIYTGMQRYLSKKPDGKMFHDPLAVCAAIDSTIIEWREVEMYIGEKGKWGARLKPGTNTFISVRADQDAFFRVLIGKKN